MTSPHRLASFSAVAVLCLVGGGCATGRTRNSDFGEWREVQSPHFRVRTNLGGGAAEHATYQLEQLRSALLAGAFDLEQGPPGRLMVVLFRDPKELVEFADSRVDGFVTSTPQGPLLVSSGSDLQGGEGRSKVLHELSHYLSSFVLLRQPRWYAEGLAEYIETMTTAPGSVRLGGVNAENLKVLRQHGPLPLETLWNAEEPGSTELAFSFHFYASSWLWFHFLVDRYPTRIKAFEAMLRRAENPAEAFATAFSNVRPNDRDDELQKYLTTEKFAVRVENIRSVPVSASVKPMVAADVHALRAELFLQSPARRTADEKQSLAQWELAQALRRDAHHTDAVVLQSAFQKPEQRLLAARELVKARPDDGKAWTFLAGELSTDPGARAERDAALDNAVRLAPDDAVALNNLAWEKVQRGSAAEALQLSERAVRIVPWSPGMLDTYAAALYRVGRCPEARMTQQRAIDLLHDEVGWETRQQLLAALMQYRAKCPGRDDL